MADISAKEALTALRTLEGQSEPVPHFQKWGDLNREYRQNWRTVQIYLEQQAKAEAEDEKQ